DNTLVAGGGAAQGAMVGICNLDQLVLVAHMSGSADHVELGGHSRIIAGENYFLVALGDVEAVFVTQLVYFAVHGDFTVVAFAADVEDANLPALQEIMG